MIPLLLLFVLAGLTLLRIAKREPSLARIAAAGLAMHLVFAFGQQWVVDTYYRGVGDVYHFSEFGGIIARAMHNDFGRVVPEVFKMIFHVDAQLPWGWVSHGSGSTTVDGLTGLLFYVLGDSLIISFMAVSMMTWFSQILLATTLSECVRQNERKIAQASVFLVPSVVFWSSGIIKEAFVLTGLCLLCHCLYRVTVRRSFGYVGPAVIGALLVALIKPYTLFPFVVAIAAWVMVSRSSTVRIRPISVVIALVIAVGGVVAFGQIFPTYSFDKLGESAALQQENWGDGEGVIAVGSSSSSLASQVPFLPLALVNSLFRPFPFESPSLTAIGASAETATLLVVFLMILWRFRLSAVRQELLGSPLLVASLTFTLLFGIAVGLVTKNLGSLSRYRMPMIPFYVLTMMVLLRRLQTRSGSLRSRATPTTRHTAIRLSTTTGRT